MSHMKQDFLSQQEQIQTTQMTQRFVDQTKNTIQMIIDYIQAFEQMQNNNNSMEEKQLEFLNFRATQGLNMYNMSSQGLYENKHGEKGIKLGMSKVNEFLNEVNKQNLSPDAKKRLDPLINYMIACLQNKKPPAFAPPKLFQFDENVVSNGMSTYLSSQHKIQEKDEEVKKDYKKIQASHDENVAKNKKNIQNIQNHKVESINNIMKSSLQDVNDKNVDHNFRENANNSSSHQHHNDSKELDNKDHKHNHRNSHSKSIPDLEKFHEQYYENDNEVTNIIDYVNEIFDIINQYPLDKIFKKYDAKRLNEIQNEVSKIEKQKKLSNHDGMQVD